jgi:glycyl-tRNA synthetase (class II)
LTRLFLAVLIDAYTAGNSPQPSPFEGEGETSRIYLKLNPKLAPIKV